MSKTNRKLNKSKIRNRTVRRQLNIKPVETVIDKETAGISSTRTNGE